MHDSKLINLLSTIEKEEMRAFRQFVLSPYHNTNKQVIGLFEYLARFHPQFNQSGLEKRRVYTYIHPKGRAYHDGRMNLIMTQLTKLIYDFLAIETFKQNDYWVQQSRINAFQKRGMDRDFFKEVERMEKTIESWADNEKKYLEQYLLSQQRYNHPEVERYHLNMECFDQCLKALDAFFVWEKIDLAVKAHNRTQVLNENYDIKLLPEVLSIYEKEIQQSDVLEFKSSVLKFYAFGDESLLKDPIGLLKSLVDVAPHTELRNFFFLVHNILADKCRNGAFHLKYKLFEFYKFGLDIRLLFHNKGLSDIIFINIASTGAACGAFPWVQSFFRMYESYLKVEDKEDTLLLAKSYLEYHQAVYSKDDKMFESAIENLRTISYNKPFFAYRARTILLRAYYDYYLRRAGEEDFVLDFTNAFERQISRDRSLPERKKLAFSNFIQFARRLTRMKFDNKRRNRDLKMVEKEIVESQHVFAKDWLMEKIGELQQAPR